MEPTEEELQAAAETLAKAKPDAAAAALRAKALPVYHQVYNAGQSDAEGPLKTKLEAAEKDKREAEEAKTKAEREVKELKKGMPDLERVQSEHAAELTREREASGKKISSLEATIQQERTTRVRSEIVKGLVEAGVDADYADLIADREMARVTWAADGSAQVLQKGLSIPVTPPSGTSHVKVLVDEVAGAVPERFRASGIPSGSGGAGAQKTFAAGSTEASVEEARKRGEEQRKAATTEDARKLAFT